MKDYLNLAQRIVDDGVWVENERTGERCLTVINADLTYDVGGGKFPLITTRKSFWKAAVAELLGYIRGYDNAEDFYNLGAKTWFANANDNKSWVDNPFRKGTNDMGRVYGVQGRHMQDIKLIDAQEDNDVYINKVDMLVGLGYYYNGATAGGFCDTVWKRDIDQLRKVYEHLRNGIDDRGEIINFLHQGDVEFGCLRPCMYSHHFSLLGDTLYLNSTQRSCDVPLGLNFNMVQVYVFLAIMAQITGKKAGYAHHKMVNAHIYEKQLDLMRDVQLKRTPLQMPKFKINPKIKTLEDLETWVTLDDFSVEDYEHLEPIKYPFTV